MQILDKYLRFVEIMFFCFLLGVLSFGRAFSVLNFNIKGFPFFITEIVLLTSLPYIVIYGNRLYKLPRLFLGATIMYFSFGCLYLCFGILNKNMFAIRDIVLCGYVLFLSLAFLILSRLSNLKRSLAVVIFGNIFAIIAGLFFIYNLFPLSILKLFLSNLKNFNLGFSYGFSISFLICFYDQIKKRMLRIFVLFLISLNFCMLVMLSVRTVWIACVAIAVFFLLIYGKRFIKTIIELIPPVIILLSILLFFDYKLIGRCQLNKIISKTGSLNVFVSNSIITRVSSQPASAIVSLDKVREVSSRTALTAIHRENLDNINWRLGIWKQSIEFGLASPLFGRGYGIYPAYRIAGKPCSLPKNQILNSGVTPVHNHLISIFYKMGFLGLGLFLFINIYTFLYGLRYINKCKTEFIRNFLIGSLGAFIFWHTMALFFDMIDSPPTSIFLWIIIGLIFGVITIDKEYKNGSEFNE